MAALGHDENIVLEDGDEVLDDPMLSLLEQLAEEALSQKQIGISSEDDYTIKDLKEVIPHMGGPGTHPTVVGTNKAVYILFPFEPLKKVSAKVDSIPVNHGPI